MVMFLDRRRWLVLLGVIVALVSGTIWFYQPDRQLHRAWGGLISAIEARNTSRLGRILADDYQDRWGYDRGALLDDARLAFFQFRQLAIEPQQVEMKRDADRATISALLRLEAEGGGQVNAARARINGLFSPFTFEWRREPGFWGNWKLVRFDHAELELGEFRDRW